MKGSGEGKGRRRERKRVGGERELREPRNGGSGR